MPLAPGARVDRYEVLGLLGRGGMGEVYRALDPRLDREVALKLLHADSSLGTDGAVRLVREARAIAALTHPSVLAVYDVGEVQEPESLRGTPCIAMELVVGSSLRRYVADVRTPPMDRRIEWLKDIAGALAAAHRAGIVHRDVKPENIMIRFDGVVRVLDFGLARRGPASTAAVAVDDETGAPTPTIDKRVESGLTAPGTTAGTPLYMSPEQMRGKPVDGRADQFSWGVLAYELLSGRLPWPRDVDPRVVVSQVLTKEPLALRTLAPEVPLDVEAAVMRALAKSADDRFASMDEIVRQLDPTGSRQSLSAPPEDLVSAPEARDDTVNLEGATRTRPSVSSSPPRKRGRVIFVGFVVASVVIAAVGVKHRMRSSSTIPDGGLVTTLLNLPLPSTNAEALAAYLEGMRKLRLGDIHSAVESLKRAAELDPLLASALLRIGRWELFSRPAEARDYFRRATQGRASLPAHDQLLLDALAPLFEHDPADLLESRRRLAELTQRYPLDAEFAFELASIDERRKAYDPAGEEYDRAIALDPGFGHALNGKADNLFFKGDAVGAIEVTRTCDRAAPGSSRCRAGRAKIESLEGRCDDLQDDARKIILTYPARADGYALLAEALADTGSPMGTVREAVVQARARMTDAEKAAANEEDIAVLDGHFDEAKNMFALQEGSLKESAQELDHADLAWARIELAVETGNEAEAIGIAADFRTRSRAWSLPPDATDWMLFDARLPILSLLAREQRIPLDELEEARTSAAATTSDPRVPQVWFGTYAWPADTPAEAKVALDALPRFKPLPRIWGFFAEFPVGRAYLLAGHVDDALPHLVRATSACDLLSNTFDHMHASLLLGQALESKSDLAGACTAYRSVLAHWGNAKPRSITADAARARVKALTCP